MRLSVVLVAALSQNELFGCWFAGLVWLAINAAWDCLVEFGVDWLACNLFLIIFTIGKLSMSPGPQPCSSNT